MHHLHRSKRHMHRSRLPGQMHVGCLGQGNQAARGLGSRYHPDTGVFALSVQE